MVDTRDDAERAIDPVRDYRFDFGDQVVTVPGAKLLEHADETVQIFRALRGGNERVAQKIMRRILKADAGSTTDADR